MQKHYFRNMIRKKKIAVLGGILLTISIILGALGAHALKKVLGPDQLQSFNVATHYLTIHGLAFLILSMIRAEVDKAVQLLLYGLVLFSGSIYTFTILSYAKVNVSYFGLITPLGGIMMIAAWIFITIALAQAKEHKSSSK